MQVVFTTESLLYPFYLCPIGPDGDIITTGKNNYSQLQQVHRVLLAEHNALMLKAREGQETIKRLENMLQRADVERMSVCYPVIY